MNHPCETGSFFVHASTRVSCFVLFLATLLAVFRAAGSGARREKKSDSVCRRAESSGILKKIRGRFAMARLKAIESRSGFRYEGFLGS